MGRSSLERLCFVVAIVRRGFRIFIEHLSLPRGIDCRILLQFQRTTACALKVTS
jgi:hypothetical protein